MVISIIYPMAQRVLLPCLEAKGIIIGAGIGAIVARAKKEMGRGLRPILGGFTGILAGLMSMERGSM
jgi:uncharacterized membrane protein YfcA